MLLCFQRFISQIPLNNKEQFASTIIDLLNQIEPGPTRRFLVLFYAKPVEDGDAIYQAVTMRGQGWPHPNGKCSRPIRFAQRMPYDEDNTSDNARTASRVITWRIGRNE